MAQHERGHKVIVITRSAENDTRVDSQFPFDVIRVPSKKSIPFGLKSYIVIRKLSFRPDIIHSHGPAGFYYLVQRNSDSPPLVHTMHAVRKYQFGLFRDLPVVVKKFEKVVGAPAVKKPKYYKTLSLGVRKEFFLEKYICQHADHIVVVAKYFADQINEYYSVPHDKITVAYNGSKFDSTEAKTADISVAHSFGLDLNSEIILYVGRTDWVKRVHLLVEAMPLLLKKFPHAFLVIAGTGDQSHDLLRLIEKLGLIKSVKLLGWIPHEDLPSLFKVTKCFCLPSYWEGLSKSLLEAMSARIPVIATDNPSNNEILQNGIYGLLVKEPTPEAWSKAIAKILFGGTKVEQTINRASLLLDKMYRWEHVAQRIDMAYQKVLAQ